MFFWFKRAHVILGQIWRSFLFFSKVHFVSFVYTLTLLVNSTEEGHICRPQNLSQFYFYINFEPNFVLRFQIPITCVFLAHSLFNSFYYFVYYFILFYYYYFYLFIYLLLLLLLLLLYFILFLFFFSLSSLLSSYSPITPFLSPHTPHH